MANEIETSSKNIEPGINLRIFLTIALRILSAHNFCCHLARARARAH